MVHGGKRLESGGRCFIEVLEEGTKFVHKTSSARNYPSGLLLGTAHDKTGEAFSSYDVDTITSMLE